MRLQISLRRVGYRAAHRLLRLYWLLARPSLTGVKCLLIDGETVLLVRHTYGERGWDLPGGHIRRDESPGEAARREMAEELGVDLVGWTSIGELHVREHHRHDTLYCFQARVQAPRIKLDLGELERADWFPCDALPTDRREFVDQVMALRMTASSTASSPDGEHRGRTT